MQLVSVVLLLAGLLAAGCTTPGGQEPESLDVSQWAADEGAFAVRFFTTMADEDALDRPDTAPKIKYSVRLSPSKGSLRPSVDVIPVNAQAGPALAVRKLPAGEYHFDQLVLNHPGGLGGGPGAYVRFPIEVEFTVRPGQVTYIGDLSVHIVEKAGLLGLGGVFRCSLEASSSPDEVRALLAGRYPGSAPHIEAIPMQIR